MAGQSTTIGLQVSGFRFLVRRMEHALVRGDVRMLDDPLRAQSLSLIVGCVLAVFGVAACAVLAFVSPRGALGSDPIVMDRGSGALYVRMGDIWHPALNLASAQLITGSSAQPKAVAASVIQTAQRGPSVGIPGAPDVIGRPLENDESSWSVCEDGSERTTVVVGESSSALNTDGSVLVVPRGESAATTTYLMYDGRRARIDLRDHAVVRALRLDGVVPRTVSRLLFDTVPEEPDIVAPRIANAGLPSALRGFPTGSVLRVNRAQSAEYYVALAGGAQRVGEMTADLLTFSRAGGRRQPIVDVDPGVVGAVPVRDDLPVDTFPERGGVGEDPVLCTRWNWESTSAKTTVLSGDSLPGGGTPVRLAQADDAGVAVDAVLLPRGRSAFVRATGVTGDGAGGGALYLVDDSGVLFGIHGDDAARRIGLSGQPVPAPWPVLARLPRGPELSVEGASVVRDSVGSSP